jgi:N-acetylglucosaminyldiphosphoundecaprenol N-acetyl-beta-D-mannosaminyltransferase
MRRTYFLDMEFDPLNAEEAARSIAMRARKLGPFAYVATPNVDHMVRLDKQPGLMPLYDDAWLNLCDSRILEAFANASYLDLPAAPGTDVVENLFRDHIRPGEPVVVIGGTQILIDRLRERFGLKDVRWFDAPLGLKDDPAARAACVRFIRENPAPFVFLAVGSPQQELIAREARIAGDCAGVAICCGASLEFLTGITARAPQWMRAHRLEWLYRLAAEPGRLWKRYLIDGPRIFLVWHRWRTQARPASATANAVAVSPH